ncbi:hypothetical protein REH70_10885 [Cellulomonas sp. ATA003]|nr:hypothetical protein [Cellulomonas sp. ATA003]WNB84381.1 hypothetical protein REH70_10885 [Cellulomonas sp. ATA003]
MASALYRSISSIAPNTLSNACWSFSGSTVARDAPCWMAVPCVRSSSEVATIMSDVVALSASTCASTIRCCPSACEVMTATRSAAMVVSRARSTPLMSSTLFFLTTSSAR